VGTPQHDCVGSIRVTIPIQIDGAVSYKTL